MDIKKVAVIGEGGMGRGLCIVFAKAGIDVIWKGLRERLLKKSYERLKDNIEQRIQKFEFTEVEKKILFSKISTTIDIDLVSDADLVIEAITEDFKLKKELLEELEDVCDDDIIFASNTTTCGITDLASEIKHPERVIGMIFHYPPSQREVVEIVKGQKTSEETYNIVKKLANQLGKKTVDVYESPGYVTTRSIIPFVNEAMAILMEGVANAKDIDTAVKLSYNMSQGPLELADYIGLDNLLTDMNTLFKELGDPKFRPSPILRQMVREGKLGKKNGIGFFEYKD
jgi:3-hydroxybutyryl-CoA dehydrogenase